MCSSGTFIDATSYYGFSISATGETASVTVNPLNFYLMKDDLTFDISNNATTVNSPILTTLNSSLCSCQNVLYKVLIYEIYI